MTSEPFTSGVRTIKPSDMYHECGKENCVQKVCRRASRVGNHVGDARVDLRMH